MKDFKENDLPNRLTFVDKALVANNGGDGWLVGDSVS